MASTSSEKKPKLGLIAIEADFSGYATKKDIIIAAAISTCRNGCNDASQIDTMSVRLDLNKTHKKSWRKIWKKKKWDLKYFDDNWQERLEALDEIDDDSTATVEYTRRTFAMKFNEMLRECEERYQKTIILFTEPSTPTVINFMLRRYNFPVLASNRDGSDRETFGLDVDSAIVGVLGLKTKLHKDVSYDKAFNACIKPHLLCGKEDSWLPSANTKYTIVKYLAACKYAKKINKPEKRSRPTLHIDFSDVEQQKKLADEDDSKRGVVAIAIEELKTAPAKLTPILSVGIEVAPADCSDPSEITSSTVNLYVEITPKWMRDAEGARIAEFIWSHWSEHKADFMEKLGKKARSFQSREMNSPLVFKERVDAAIQCHTSMYSHVSIMVDASRVEISDMLSFHLRTQGHIPTCFKEDGSYVYPNAFHLGDNTRAVVQRYVGPSGNVEREIQKYKESLIPHMPINTLEPHEYNTNARIILFEYLALAKARSLKLKK